MRLIIDGDYPMAMGSMFLDRDLTLPIDRVRTAAEGTNRGLRDGWPDNETMATLPEMRRGGVAVALVKLHACILRPDLHPHGDCRNRDIAYALAQGQLAYYRILEARGEANLLKSGTAFGAHMKAWLEAEDYEGLPVGMVLGMEGADPIHWPEQVTQWWDDGVRVISLSHYGVSGYSHGTGTGTDGGLSPEAPALLREMESLGMILDVTHTSDQSIREELEIFSGPVLASHQNCRALCPGERQHPDEILTVVIERGGVIGASMDTWMIYPPGVDWADIPPRRQVFAREEVTLEHLANHIDHVCQLAGNSHHASIGGDTDGQGGRDGAPYEIDTVADYQKLGDVLERRGYAEQDIENVMYRNWQRFYEKWLPSED